ncbi:MAG: hypothetical protein CSYNP_00813 [Syntrophus sp. SKADARSKE-3]|nr:hypothetical protein [Syntrophus sp. SKADARSKE-3]
MRNRKTLCGLLIILGTLLLSSDPIEALTITSTTFKYNANIPTAQACTNYSGTNSNPQLSLSNIPSSTKAFALIMDDPDAPGGTYLHWLMYWNSPNITSMNESSVPSGAVQGINDNSSTAYFGPCPPSNHRYFFRVYALDTTLSLSSGFTRSQLESAMNGHILESNFLMGWFPNGGANCTYTLSPQSIGFSNSAATGNVAVTCSSSNCTWTAASNYSWLTITSGSSGTGNGTVAYSVATNNTASRTGTISIVGQTATITQSSTAVTNSVGSQNSIKVTDMSGTLSVLGAPITVRAWDVNGTAIPESASATPLKLYSYGTTAITGTSLATRFPSGIPTLYELTVDSPIVIITNVKTNNDGSLNIPLGYTSGVANFITNSVGSRNSIKVTDMSGSLSTSGAAISVSAWDSNGNSIPESGSATTLKLYNNGTTTIAGADLMARFPTGTPMSYQFAVDSSRYVIVNVKSSADGTINIPYAFTSGTSNFVANSIGSRNTIKITDMSGSLSTSGAAITVKAWDANGIALTESSTATPLLLYNHGTTTIQGTSLISRFPSGSPMAYEFTVNSTKYVITNTKNSSDGSITIPFVYRSGTTNYVINSVSSLNTIKITDVSGILPTSGANITINAWDVNGNAIAESGSATPLKLYSKATTTINGSDLIARFPGTPLSYEFTIGSTQYEITNLVANSDNTLNVPSVYSSGVSGGI